MQATAEAQYSEDTNSQPPVEVSWLDEIVQLHILWLQSEGAEGRRANFAGKDLTGLNLHGLYLPEANFRAARLESTDLSYANLQGADFSESYMAHANLRYANLDGAKLARVNASSVYFDGASMIGVNLSQAICDQSSAMETNMTTAKCRDASMQQVNFSYAILAEANLRYCQMHLCHFDYADLSNTDCRDTVLDGSRFTAATLYQTLMRGASLESVKFTDADFNRVIDMDNRYQTESIHSEKESIREEIENLYAVREEVAQYEKYINEQRREIATKRRLLEQKIHQESMLLEALTRYKKRFLQLGAASVTALLVMLAMAFIIDPQMKSMLASKQTHLIFAGALVGLICAQVATGAIGILLSRSFGDFIAKRTKVSKQAAAYEQKVKRDSVSKNDDTDASQKNTSYDEESLNTTYL